MEKLGFFTSYEAAQVRAINNAADELDGQRYQIAMLRRTCDEQQVQIRRLGAALQAVCDALVDLELIPAEALRYRVEAAMAEVGAGSESAPASPFDRVAPDEPKVQADIQCEGCRRHVPAAQISFTDHGPSCDACVAAAAIAAHNDRDGHVGHEE